MASKPVFPQIAAKIIQLPASELRCPARAWKVNLLGEGADDAGGVFDETIAQMSEVVFFCCCFLFVCFSP